MSDEEFYGINDEELLKIYNTSYDFVIRLKNGTLIHTNDEEMIEEYEKNEDTVSIFWASDFEAFFDLKNELIRRNLLVG